MREHTRLLLEKTEHAVRAARVLLDAEESEFAAGRVYYAMFYVAEALLYERGLVFRKHTAVHAAYGKEFAKTGQLDPKFHRWLLTAFDARIQGDYQVTPRVTGEDVEMSLDRAKQFLAAARCFLGQGDSSAEDGEP